MKMYEAWLLVNCLCKMSAAEELKISLRVRFFRFYFFGVAFPILTIFLAICSILELEAAMSTAFAAFLSQNLSFRTVHGTW
jgi:hypothetical protein